MEAADRGLCLHLLFKLKHHGSMSVWLLLCHQDKTLKEFYEAIEHLKKSDHVKLAQGKVYTTEVFLSTHRAMSR